MERQGLRHTERRSGVDGIVVSPRGRRPEPATGRGPAPAPAARGPGRDALSSSAVMRFVVEVTHARRSGLLLFHVYVRAQPYTCLGIE